jgi:tRNA(fMet)-specific endonuclease VapC
LIEEIIEEIIEKIIEEIIEVRQQSRLKLPDSIIAAMALQNFASLITSDREFDKVITLTVIRW